MTGPDVRPGAGRPPDHPQSGGRDGGRFEEREARRLGVRLAAAQRRLGDPADAAPPSPSLESPPTPELEDGSARRLRERLLASWMRRGRRG
jgi:hypothetical protein